MDLISDCMALKLSGQVRYLFHVAIIVDFSLIWFAQNEHRFDNVVIHFSEAWVFVQRAIGKLIIYMGPK